jgi:23S rRNA (cytosine1962-C5)-methyltransferase
MLKTFQEADKKFEVVILDPPAFVKNKQKLEEGLRGYWEINKGGMEVLLPGGMLITSSCSYHVSPSVFQEVVRQAAQSAGRTARVLEMRGQAKDHPMLLAAPETSYLKCMIVEVE